MNGSSPIIRPAIVPPRPKVCVGETLPENIPSLKLVYYDDDLIVRCVGDGGESHSFDGCDDDDLVRRRLAVIRHLGGDVARRNVLLRCFDATAPTAPSSSNHLLPAETTTPSRRIETPRPQSVPLGARLPKPTPKRVLPRRPSEGRRYQQRGPSGQLMMMPGPKEMIIKSWPGGYVPSTAHYPRDEPDRLDAAGQEKLIERLTRVRPRPAATPPVRPVEVIREKLEIDIWLRQQQRDTDQRRARQNSAEGRPLPPRPPPRPPRPARPGAHTQRRKQKSL
eukprot:PhM_4_TR18069/c2_g1_i1/m.102009